MEFLSQYGLFLAEIITLVAAILITLAGVIGLISKSRPGSKEQLSIKSLNDKYDTLREALKQELLTKKEYKQYHKQQKQAKKEQKESLEKRRKVFVINFHGDIRASAVEELRQEVTAVLTAASKEDEVIVLIESGGGMVHTYGLAASQLQRIRDRHIPLTVCIDKVAASGGYLMACVADRIIAAPFAIVGSIGVLAQLPNFSRLLKKKNIDFEQLTAGEYKRTLTVFGENTDKARKKFKEDLELIHHLFKEHILKNRPKLDVERVATGEHWLGTTAHELQLVDQLLTSDDYLLQLSEKADLLEISYTRKKKLAERLLTGGQTMISRLISPY